MPSRFPGMDPYLEAGDIWLDFQARLAFAISDKLNQSLPRPCYARLEMRLEAGNVEEAGRLAGFIPDELLRHHLVEIRDATSGHKLVTLIEILSPSNKRPGPDREAYLRRQREVLESDVSLVEIDLLRAGERALVDPRIAVTLDQLTPPPDYLVLVSRAWDRVGTVALSVYPCALREWLPCIGVPVKQGEAELPLDLQYLVNRTYDSGPYRRGAIDYSRPPAPPVSAEDADWAEALVREAFPLADD